MVLLRVNREIIKRLKIFYCKKDILKIDILPLCNTDILVMKCLSKIEHYHFITINKRNEYLNYSNIEFTIRFNMRFTNIYLDDICYLLRIFSTYFKNNNFKIEENKFILFPTTLNKDFYFKGFYVIQDPHLGSILTIDREIIFYQIILIDEIELNFINKNNLMENTKEYLKGRKYKTNRLFIH